MLFRHYQPRGKVTTTTRHLSQDQVKHLEFIQATINRISGNSFLIKGWTLTVTSALLAFATSSSNWHIALTSFVPLVAFWLLDSYFLRQERLFRGLYNDARRPNSSVEPFSMDLHTYRSKISYSRSIWSFTLTLFYGGLLMAHLFILITNAIK
ncbi:hypothetical protein DKM19_36080 [Streptosporangium sp. 'caverna']|nr:hypothetical protein DKM19_36080 [Streptosporangium sp. 'caverna']